MSEQEKRTYEVMRTAWQNLLGHHRRKAVLFVSPPVDLKTAAEAMALDQTRVVEAWLQSGHLMPTNDTIAAAIKADEELEFIIVQPFVLVGLTIEFN